MAERQTSCGAIWRKQDRNGKDYFFIVITIGDKKMSFNAFENTYKKEEKHPDYRIFVPNITGSQYKPWGGNTSAGQKQDESEDIPF
jgi:uncharacterized protein (DUF736 family)